MVVSVNLRRFVCLTDNPYYTNEVHKGHAGLVSIGNGKRYPKELPIQPSWAGKWKDSTRDAEITLKADVEFSWRNVGIWHYLFMEV